MLLLRILILSLFCIFSMPVFTQTNNVKEYIIEVIVFEQLEISGDEKLDPEPLNLNNLKTITLLKKPEILIDTKKIIQSFNYEDSSNVLNQLNIKQMIEDEDDPSINIKKSNNKINTYKWYEKQDSLSQLDNIYRRLNRRKEYRVLHKLSWFQPAINYIDSPFVHEVYGKNGFLIKLYQSRYLHLDVIGYLDGKFSTDKNKEIIKEIKLDALQESIPETVLNQEIEISSELLKSKEIFITAKESKQEKSELFIKNAEVKYLLKEERRIFKNESHYFDHPRFGLIISVYDSSL
jgi:hypothetical protein